MDLKKYILLAVLIVALCLPSLAFSVVAFPGAEGMGANSVGGRNGTVLIVDTLSDNPADGLTFREAVTASYKRIVVFAVTGIIDLDSELQITEPYLTIAGETSPGGVLVTGWSVRIKTHDVIMRHMRFRNSCQKCFAAGNCEQGDTLSVYSDASHDVYNVIIDHCSISWGCDETMDFAAEYGRLDNITVSHSIIAEGVNDAHPEPNHARGLFMWGKHTVGAPGSTDNPIKVTFLRNLVMSFYSRLPLANFNVSFDFVNNVIYNFKSVLTPTIENLTGYKIETNMIHNYIKPGPNSASSIDWPDAREMVAYGSGPKSHMAGTPYEMIYTVGNIGYTRTDQTGDDWLVAEGYSPIVSLSKDYQKTTPFQFSGDTTFTYKTMSAACADIIAENAGALKPSLDSVDTRLVSEYKAGNQGNYINMADVVFPTFTHPGTPTDNDSDGMADSWETSEGLNVGSNDSALDKDSDGYTNIEEYLHYLADVKDLYNADCLPDFHPPAAPTNLTTD